MIITHKIGLIQKQHEIADCFINIVMLLQLQQKEE